VSFTSSPKYALTKGFFLWRRVKWPILSRGGRKDSDVRSPARKAAASLSRDKKGRPFLCGWEHSPSAVPLVVTFFPSSVGRLVTFPSVLVERSFSDLEDERQPPVHIMLPSPFSFFFFGRVATGFCRRRGSLRVSQIHAFLVWARSSGSFPSTGKDYRCRGPPQKQTKGSSFFSSKSRASLSPCTLHRWNVFSAGGRSFSAA